MQVLGELIAHAGNVVPREQLIALLWPRGVVDFDTGLNTVIRKLRTALGDTSETPRYIETLPRRGYRFIGALDPDPGADSSPSPAHGRACAVPAALPEPAPGAGLVPPQASSEAAPVFTSGELASRDAATSSNPSTVPPLWRPRLPFLALIAALAAMALLMTFLAKKFWHSPVTASSRAPVAAASETAAAIPAASIAILPFVDMSERKDQEYFSDGLSDELIELLGRTAGLRVVARTSSFYFKGKSEKLETIAQELRVANVLEGSVRKDGSRLRVTAQLVRADTSEHLWSETFDRDLYDVFKVQDEIAAAVVSALKVHLLAAQRPTARDELGTASLEAYDQVLLGMQSYNRGDLEGYQRAVAAFRAAIGLDPGYARAYALLALAQFWVADYRGGNAAGFDRAVEAAEKAVELGPEQASSYAARGFLRAVYLFDFSGAQSDLDKAVELNPGDADVLHRSAVVLATLGRLPAAISREQQALALDPLSAEISMRLGFFMAADQQLARARPLYEKSLAIAENSIRANFNLGDLELLENQPAQALATFQKNESEAFRLVGQAKAEYSLGHLDASQQALERLIAGYGTRAAANIAQVYAWRGEKDQAFAWAERAYALRDPGLTWIKIDTSWRRLHGEPRYHALLRKMKLPDN